MGMGFAPTWLRQVSPPPLLHKTTLTTVHGLAEHLQNDLGGCYNYDSTSDWTLVRHDCLTKATVTEPASCSPATYFIMPRRRSIKR